MTDHTFDAADRSLERDSAGGYGGLLLRGVKRFIAEIILLHLFAFWVLIWFIVVRSNQFEGDLIGALFSGVVFIGIALVLLVRHVGNRLGIDVNPLRRLRRRTR